MKALLPLIFCVIPWALWGQSPEIKSIRDSLQRAKSDSAYISLLNDLAYEYLYLGEIDSALSISERIVEKSRKAKSTNGEVLGYYLNAYGNYLKGNYTAAIAAANQTLNLSKTIQKASSIRATYNLLGSIYIYIADYEEAIKNYEKSLTLSTKNNDTVGISSAYSNIANVYLLKKETSFAKSYFLKSYLLDSASQNLEGMASSLTSLGNCYAEEKNHELSIRENKKALEIREELGIVFKKQTNLINLGTSYLNKKEYALSEQYLRKAEELSKKSSDLYSLTIINQNLGRLYYLKKNYQQAKTYASEGLKNAKKIKAKERIYGLAYLNYEIDSALGNTISAMKHLHMTMDYKDSVNSLEAERAANRFQVSQKNLEIKNLEEKQRLLAENNRILAQKEEEQRKASIYLTAGLSTLALLVVALAVAFVLKRRDNDRIAKLNVSLSQYNEEILSQNEEINAINEQLDHKNSELNSSIKYAKRIQDALVASEGALQQLLPESFLYFSPKDLVSGDFFWLAKSKNPNKFMFAAIDCTGHGVPGAFMSVMVDSFLSNIVYEQGIEEPSQVLQALHNSLISSLGKGNPNTVSEGLDLVLCKIDKENMECTFSGALNPLIEVIDDHCITHKTDRKSVGKTSSYGIEREFHQHTFSITKNSTYFIFTDGITDQFGGPKGRKLMLSRLKDKLIEFVNTGEMQKGEKYFRNFLEKWQGHEMRIDDQLMVGFRIS